MKQSSGLSQALGFLRQGKPDEAEVILKDILKKNPDDFDALRLRGIACHLRGNNEQAVRFLQDAIAARPDSADAHYNLGVAQNALKRHEEAVGSFERAIELKPDDPEVHDALGGALTSLKRYGQAISSFRRAIEIQPDFTEAHNNLGVALKTLNRWSEAVGSFQLAIELNPRLAEAHINLGGVLNHLNRYEEAVKPLQQAIGIQSNSAEAHNNLGAALNKLNRYEEALACYNRAIEIDPSHHNAFSQRAFLSRRICDWSTFSQAEKELTERLREDLSAVSPFMFLSLSDNPEDQLLCARLYVEHKNYSDARRPPSKAAPEDERIRVAYVSADFCEHATAYLIAELFERHNREKFEVIGISFGPDDNSPIRNRLRRAFDHFVDVRTTSDHDAAELIANRKIHIAVDLKGYTANARPVIFAHRPAPIQVNYLGYPGTMGADFIDYIVVDDHVVPADQQSFFSEQLVHLPDSYQVNDGNRTIAKRTPSRRDAGLPDKGFVFCSFNNNYKITPLIFDIWMRLLEAIPQSVLWLLEDNEFAVGNLRQEAAARNVEPARLVFAPRVKLADHLARHRLADLFLDTLPCNAHTTASDALWTSLPVLTCTGRSFASRVAGSLLTAVGLPELITHTLEGYETLALKLARNRDTQPLFDCPRFCGHLEAAYETMFETWRAGKPPAPIKVPPAP